ncbi:hypothetical protein CKO28_20805 [Rhodovibrio sodomensis]|uniref:Uncharacterized protein n=1 Tax=Rhodovibrio sodomensis TaxID=1088 RepID=A0ABS1DJT8_9PROT|nr:hypothetical protein [Rhodovibrio sodomensis]MBK1670469.1 hypothetical protein [Rhodovibrio sodomensis]
MAKDGDDRFEPKLGRIRARGGRTGKTYLQRVLHAASLAGPGIGQAGRSAFSGTRIGRGCSATTTVAGERQPR